MYEYLDLHFDAYIDYMVFSMVYEFVFDQKEFFMNNICKYKIPSSLQQIEFHEYEILLDHEFNIEYFKKMFFHLSRLSEFGPFQSSYSRQKYFVLKKINFLNFSQKFLKLATVKDYYWSPILEKTMFYYNDINIEIEFNMYASEKSKIFLNDVPIIIIRDYIQGMDSDRYKNIYPTITNSKKELPILTMLI